MDTEDGQLFIKNLSYYVRTHEKALANAIQSQSRQRPLSVNASTVNGLAPLLSASSPPQSSAGLATGTLASALSFPLLGFGAQPIKTAKLYLTPNQLYYLLSRFEELGVTAGPMNVRLENIHAEHAPSNYVSFLHQSQHMKGRPSDQDSIHSVSSVRSVMSSVSSMWSSFSLTNTNAKMEKRKAAELEDLRYLYSAFTKIPCLKLALDHRIPRIAGYEEFPFDTAVPVYVFKNLSTLEIMDLDFRNIFGWDRLADQLRTLTLKRANIDDLNDLLVNIVLDDTDRRRRRSAKTSTSPISAYPTSNSFGRYSDTARSCSTPDSPILDEQRGFGERPISADMSLSFYPPRPGMAPRMTSMSPPRPSSSRRGSTYNPGRPMGKVRQSSGGSSGSSMPSQTPRTSSSSNLTLLERPVTKWRQLRHLCLADNSMMSITRQSLHPIASTLHSLDLTSNLFTEIPDSLASLVSLRALNLSNCMIESLHSLARYPLPAITVLNLRGNRIASLAGIEKLLSLERLDLRENRLTDPTELARLTGMPNFQGVYVTRNPFVKTHSNYRITIFNLFRHVPGYDDDITIDGTGPGYSERRHLIDRVPETANGPVIRPPIDEDVTPSLSDDKGSSTTTEGPSDDLGPETPTTPVEDPMLRGSRRKKGPKRRIVDIASSDSCRSYSNDSMSYLKPQQATPASRGGEERRPSLHRIALSPIPSSPDGHLEEGNMPSIADAERPDLSLGNEQYRKRIESLKREFGSGWLSALGEDAWDERKITPSTEYTEKDIPSTNTGAVVSSTRRLG